jgi:predicted transcriptional regulator
MTEEDDVLLGCTTSIVTSYLARRDVFATGPDLSDIIRLVYGTLKTLNSAPAPVAELTPAVPIKKSVFPSHIVCLECGGEFKLLKRHLMTEHSLTPQDYRTRWSLPAEYPVVAPEYAGTRSALAKENGLGRKAA